MSKDPAFMFYSADFLIGVMDMTMEERGQYISLMCLQHQKGHLSEETIRLCVGSVSDKVMSKFQLDEKGLYYSDRLDEEIEKRAKFVKCRQENGKKGGRPKRTETDRFPVGLPMLIGVAMYFVLPEFLGATSMMVAIISGAVSGLAATGSNQVLKQLMKQAEEGTLTVNTNSTPEVKPPDSEATDKQ